MNWALETFADPMMSKGSSEAVRSKWESLIIPDRLSRASRSGKRDAPCRVEKRRPEKIAKATPFLLKKSISCLIGFDRFRVLNAVFCLGEFGV